MPRQTPPAPTTPAAKHTNRFWGSKPLPKTKAEFFDAITTPAPTGDGSIATIRMYGPIDSWGGYWGVSTRDVGDILDALPDSVSQIILRINSPGGEVFEAVSILNMFRAHRASVTAVVDGLAASAASFVAAGCDETVMSPGTQMMIHSPLTFMYGNAAELRKTADVLDGLEASIVELYTAKAGVKDWATLLADDTWLTAQAAVELGLADRVAVVPDAGDTDTVGTEDELIVLPDEDEPEDSAARIVRIAARGTAIAAIATQTPTLPSSSEPGQSNTKENAVAYSDLTAGLRERLGVTADNASDETLLAALDEALAEQPTTTVVPPEGTQLIDSTILANLQAAAAEGQQARAQQVTDRRSQLLDTAVREGRIAPSARAQWAVLLEANEDNTTALLAVLPKNVIPVSEIGHSDEPSSEDTLYAAAWGDDAKEA